METKEIIQKTEALIDALRATCSAYGLSGDSSEYKIIVQVFLYKFLNDKFGYEIKKADTDYQERLCEAEHWEDAFCQMSEDDREDLQDFVPNAPRMAPEHLIATLYNRMNDDSFATLFDSTMVQLGQNNADRYSVKTSGQSNVALFDAITVHVTDIDRRNDFARALVNNLITFNFEEVFGQSYDFFSTIFEYLISDYNKNGGGKYAEYYTPHAVATIMARLLVDDDEDLKSVTGCDPTAGTGTLVIALAEPLHHLHAGPEPEEHDDAAPEPDTEQPGTLAAQRDTGRLADELGASEGRGDEGDVRLRGEQSALQRRLQRDRHQRGLPQQGAILRGCAQRAEKQERRDGHLPLLPAAHPLHTEEGRQGCRGGAHRISDGQHGHRTEDQAAHHRRGMAQRRGQHALEHLRQYGHERQRGIHRQGQQERRGHPDRRVQTGREDQDRRQPEDPVARLRDRADREDLQGEGGGGRLLEGGDL